jgi:Mn2+/Fe2+ NRAMP family transporter
MRRLLSVILWSIIAGAFIGPGTVATAASAGSRFGLQLVWALVFSTFACVLLQEASARLTVESGLDLGQALRQRSGGGFSATAMLLLVVGAIIVGCAAYEAGNIVGAVVGLTRLTGVSAPVLTVFLGVASVALLWRGNPRSVARVFGALVAVMGVAFVVTAVGLGPDLGEILRGALVPRIPAGGGMLVLALVGTTVVPYNLFLGSGLAREQPLGEVRFGLVTAVVLGGLISIAVLVVGTAVAGEFSFDALAQVLGERLGSWAVAFFACGLFAAGFSSALSAPLAAAITARSLFSTGDQGTVLWRSAGWRFRSVWGGVLLTGLLFGITEVRPIPVILLAQALNGVLLPVVAVFLLIVVNERSLVGVDGVSGRSHTVLLAMVVMVTVLLGTSGVVRAGCAAVGAALPPESTLLWISLGVTLAGAVPVAGAVMRGRAGT